VGVPLPTGVEVWGGCCAPSRKIFNFGPQYGEFLCILSGIFVAVQLPVLHTKRYNLVPFPTIFIFFSLQIGFPFSLFGLILFCNLRLILLSAEPLYGNGGLP